MSGPAANPNYSGALVYVADDESIFAEVVAAILRSENFDTRTFDDAESVVTALESTRNKKPAVLLTDYLMPGLNGMELIIKARILAPGIKSVLFSGQVESEVLSKYAVKPDRFLGKPFQPSVLLDAIHQVLENRL